MNEDFKLKNIFDKYRENKNSHVYLVETNSIENAINDIKRLIIEINLLSSNDIKQLVENDTLPTLSIIGPKNQEIVTEDVEKMIIMLQKIPVITKENYFIIYNAEKLNKKSGNQMLKIIEEPDTEMLGFFVCNSVDSIMPTISSRCQSISLTYDISESFDDDLLNDAKCYLELIHNKCQISVNKEYVEKYKDINSFVKFVDCLIYLEKNYIDKQTNFDIIKKENEVLKMMYNLSLKVYKNCNINLLLDRFVIEVSRL